MARDDARDARRRPMVPGTGGARGAGARVGIVALLAAAALACRGPSGRGCGRPACDPCGGVRAPVPVAAPAPDGDSSLPSRPDEEELLALTDGLLRVASPSPDPAQVERARELASRVEAAGRLRPVIDRFLARLTAGSPVWSQRAKHADRVVGFVRAQLCLRGRGPSCGGLRTEPFDVMARRHEAILSGSAVPRGERTLGHPGVLAELEARGGAPYVAAEDVEVLIDGPASWRRRVAMLEGAKERVSCLTWAFYDDTTGWDGVSRLVAAAKRGVRVRVCVDAQVAEGATYAAPVRWLVERARSDGALPLEVVAWRDPARPFDGQHRKILVVDGRDAVLGGMNFGDAYSHLPRSAEFEAKATAPAGPGWRDTDVHVGGGAAVEAERVFARVWNGQVASRGLPLAPMAVPAAPVSAPVGGEGTRAAVIEQLPGRDERILLSWLTAIDAARTSVDVTNAYLVRIPSMQAALLAASRRGVRVRVLTNSEESLDEPILASAILSTAGELADGGVEVHLRKGSTLHAKTLGVDDAFCSVGSFNLHPRSVRLEGEVTVNLLGPAPAAALRAAFERDLEASTLVRSSKDLVLPDDPLGRLAAVLFPDLL